ncbi:MAG: indolepyruvate oxidoreductase subunit beta [Phycisphaerales bacterium]|nr:MAG: indolepyruvate oxidoreductase subunit beta [Phycisphaerales bacterium]
MEYNLILAGVGGQGILTIAQVISLIALRRGWHVKQAEVHGMSQRGGAVQSHLRFSPNELYSDLIPLGRADMVLAVEPLEVLRYVQYLSEKGSIVASTVPFVNIPDYPPVEQVLDKVCERPNHILVDADRLARAAGSARAANTIMVGAASGPLGLTMSEIDSAIEEIFGRKGQSVVEVNQRACRFGHNAATAYGNALKRGASATEVRHWIDKIPPEQLAAEEVLDEAPLKVLTADPGELTGPEGHAVKQTLEEIYLEGRRQLYEHEVYRLVELVGAISPPRHYFVENGEEITAAALEPFPGDKVVLKIVSPDIVHKSDVGGVMFVPCNVDAVNHAIKQLIDKQSEHSSDIAGVLVVEKVERIESGFGQELFVGIRETREFGPIIAAGLGGVDTEYLAHKMKPGVAVAKALVTDTSADEFFEQFKKTAAYDVLSGRIRGRQRVVSDGELLRCFNAFIALARHLCIDRGEEGPDLEELEVNPFAFSRQRMIPLDGRGRMATATKEPPSRPVSKIQNLLEPRSIAVMGVSAKRENFGRIILKNVRDCGFAKEHAYVIKEGLSGIDGIRCVPRIEDVPEKIDLLVVATGSGDIPEVIDSVIDSRKVASVILIPGGLGETEGTQESMAKVRQAIFASRGRGDGGPIVVGPNSLGIRSRPGDYDTFFIPENKLDPRRDVSPRRVALISQSGAFIISRMSNIEYLDPMIAVSLGNQIDVTVSDMVRVVGDREDVDCVGVYVEGFNDLDGMAFVRAVQDVSSSGKTVVFYKAGRTAPGRAATAGHTASVAGDYDICQTAVANAGAIVADTFKEFEQLVELATAFSDKEVTGRRIGAISNAGYETVGMADAVDGDRYQLEIPSLGKSTVKRIAKDLKGSKLDALVNIRNPLDLTPMANVKAYEACIRAMIDDDNIDAVIVACVPLTPQLITTADELGKDRSLADLMPEVLRESSKPVVAVIDSGSPYEGLAQAIRSGGVPVFRSSDQAVRSLGRYLCHRADNSADCEKQAEQAKEAQVEVSTA